MQAEAAPARPVDRRPSVWRLAIPLSESLGEAADAASRALCLPMALLLVRHLRFDAADPGWVDRDRLVMSPGLAAVGAHAAGRLRAGDGFFHAPEEPLGAACGMALAERSLAARFGRSLVDHRVWVFAGSDTLATGAVQEAACLAGQWRLGRLAVFVVADATGPVPGLACFAAHGWSVRRARTAEAGEIAGAISAALRSVRPTLIVCTQEGSQAERSLPAEWPGAEAGGLGAWEAAGKRSAGIRRGWLKRLARHSSRQDHDDAQAGRLPARWHLGLMSPPEEGSAAKAAEAAAARLAAAIPMLGALPGRARWPAAGLQLDGSLPGQAMLVEGLAAVLTGMALHGGVLPLGANTLIDLDRIRPSLAEAARARARLLHVLVDDDGGAPAAHMPAARTPAARTMEARTSLRAMRDVMVFEPADASEVLECFELAVRHAEGPCVILVSSARRPPLTDKPSRSRSARGAYLLARSDGPCAATLIASGAAVEPALQARLLLRTAGIAVKVISLPCWSLFGGHDRLEREALLGASPRVGIEAGGDLGWERWLGADGLFVELPKDTIPAPDTAARVIAEAVRRHLRGLVQN